MPRPGRSIPTPNLSRVLPEQEYFEVVEDESGSTYRAVYAVKFAGIVYVLHVFQKKSKSGIKTPPEEMDKVRARLKQAELHYVAWSESQEQKRINPN